MGGPFTCAVSARIVHDGRHFYGNIEKNRSMIMKADTRISRRLGDLKKARVLEGVSERRLRRTRSNRILGKPILSAVPI